MTPDTNQPSALPPAVSNEPPSGRFRGLGESIRQAVLQARLTWELFFDRRVFWMVKLIPFAGVAYVFFPLDFVPDVLPVIGQMDDLGILLASCWLFVDLCPRPIVNEHWQSLIKGKASPVAASDEKKANETVIDVSPKNPSNG
jgi:uncharacterized membrane protein YkvA (DUF1232 family)